MRENLGRVNAIRRSGQLPASGTNCARSIYIRIRNARVAKPFEARNFFLSSVFSISKGCGEVLRGFSFPYCWEKGILKNVYICRMWE